MPAKSKAQANLMRAALHGSKFPMARKVRASMTEKQMSHFTHPLPAQTPLHVKGNRYHARLHGK